MWIVVWCWMSIAHLTLFDLDDEPRGGSSPERSITAIRNDLRDVMRREARVPVGGDEHCDAIARLLAVHGEIVTHSTFADGQVLQESRALLQSRLVRIERRIRRDLQRKSGQGIRPKATRDRLPDLSQWSLHLAQRFGGPLGPGGPIAGRGGPAAGAGVGVPAGPGGAIGRMPDYGPELADLIRDVIRPEFWDVNGGPGTVVYYAPRQVLVIRATSELHHSVGAFLGDMRAANGP